MVDFFLTFYRCARDFSQKFAFTLSYSPLIRLVYIFYLKAIRLVARVKIFFAGLAFWAPVPYICTVSNAERGPRQVKA